MAWLNGPPPARRKKEVRSETIRNELRLLIRALDLAQEENVLVNAAAAKLPRNTDKRPLKFLTGEQSVVLLRALQNSEPSPCSRFSSTYT